MFSERFLKKCQVLGIGKDTVGIVLTSFSSVLIGLAHSLCTLSLRACRWLDGVAGPAGLGNGGNRNRECPVLFIENQSRGILLVDYNLRLLRDRCYLRFYEKVSCLHPIDVGNHIVRRA